jgi:hypothetical protein
MNATRNPFEGRTLIGRTMFKSPKAARLLPVAMVDSERWVPIGQLSFELQKKEGIFCLDPSVLDQPEGIRFIFKVIQNEHYDGVRVQDRLIAVEAYKALDAVMDLNEQDPDRQRMLAVRNGIARANQRSDRVVLPLDDRSCIFPRMVQDRHTGRWRISDDEDLARLPVLAFDFRDLGGGPVESGHWFYLPGKSPLRKIGTLNWEYDGDFLETLLNHVRKHIERQSSPELLGLSKAAIKRLRSLHAAGVPLHEVDDDAKAIAARLGPFLDRLEATTKAPALLASALLAHPLIVGEIEERKVAIAKEAEPAVRAEIEKRIAKELDDLYRERDALKREVEGLALKVREAQAQLERTKEMATDLLPNLRRDAEGFFGSLAEMGRRVQILREATGIAEPTPEKPAPSQYFSPWNRERIGTATEFEDEDIPTKLQDAAKRAGFDLATFAALDISLRAGDIPVIVGPGATFVLERYANVMTAGRLHTHVVDASLLGPDDLWRHPTRDDPTALASAWEAAKQEESAIHIVALRDIHRGPDGEWLETLADLLRSSGPANLFVTAITTESAGVGRRGVAIDANGGLNAALAVAATARSRSMAEPASMLRLSGGSELIDSIQDHLGGLQATSIDERGAAAFVSRRRAGRPWRGHISGLDATISRSVDLSAKPSTLQMEIRRTLAGAAATEVTQT